MPWIIWLAVAVALAAAELLAPVMILGLLAAAAAAAALAAGAGGSLLVQLLAFAVTGAAALALARPVARRHRARPPVAREGTDALIGQSAEVLAEVTAARGLVRLSGETWSARSLGERHPIPAGALVTVMAIEGATAVVFPDHPPAAPPPGHAEPSTADRK